jgi:hypothetical protein
MPGDVSRSSIGPADDTPYVPSWCYPLGKPRVCPCGHHEGYHSDAGACLLQTRCQCKGIPAECRTPDEEFYV